MGTTTSKFAPIQRPSNLLQEASTADDEHVAPSLPQTPTSQTAVDSAAPELAVVSGQVVVLTDENCIFINYGDGRIHMCHWVGEKFADGCIQEQNPWVGPGIVILGAVNLTQRFGPVFFSEQQS